MKPDQEPIRTRIAELRLELSIYQMELLEHSSDSCNCHCDHIKTCRCCGYYEVRTK